MQKLKSLKFIAFVLCSSLVWTACGSDNEDDKNPTPDPTPEVSFKNTVKPIIDAGCATSGCHVAGTGRVDFTTYEGVKSAAAGVKTKINNGSMPKTGSITDAQKTSIITWVDEGAKNN